MKQFHSKLRSLSIHKNLVMLFSLTGIGIIAFILFFYQSFSTSLEQEKEIQTKYLSSSASGIIHYFYNLAESGVITESTAKKYAMHAIETSIYGENGYFWINDGDGVLLMQPYTPELVSLNQIDMTDVNGKYIIRDFIEKAKQGGGWVAYHWPKPTSKNGYYSKLSYVSYFEPWDWILGTGVYLDDMHQNIFWVITKASGMLLIGFLLFLGIVIFIVNYFLNQLTALALYDELTGLYTKRFLSELKSSIMRKNERLMDKSLGVIFIDIDHFKKVNDTYGHNWGDKVLKQIATVVMNNTRADDYCIRFGGEEFVLVGFFTSPDEAKNIAERIRIEASKQIFQDEKVKFSITLSAGMAFYDKAIASLDKLLKLADSKLYQAKQSGRNRVVI